MAARQASWEIGRRKGEAKNQIESGGSFVVSVPVSEMNLQSGAPGGECMLGLCGAPNVGPNVDLLASAERDPQDAPSWSVGLVQCYLE